MDGTGGSMIFHVNQEACAKSRPTALVFVTTSWTETERATFLAAARHAMGKTGGITL